MAKKSRSPAVKSVRAQLDEAAEAVSEMAATPSGVNTKPLDIALSSNDVLDRLAVKINTAGAQPEVYYIPTRSTSTWVVFLFQPRLPPLTFRVSVDIVSGSVGTIEDPYIQDRVA